jgi:hypothetical protein
MQRFFHVQKRLREQLPTATTAGAGGVIQGQSGQITLGPYRLYSGSYAGSETGGGAAGTCLRYPVSGSPASGAMAAQLFETGTPARPTARHGDEAMRRALDALGADPRRLHRWIRGSCSA